jgi:hypothetical protein
MFHRPGDVAQVVEHLPNEHQAMSLNHSTAKKKQKQKQKT